jgi:hypothetical protein
VRTTIAAEAVVHTDGWQGHRQLSRLGYDHRSHSRRAAPAGEWLLPRAHRSISNLKAWLHGTHRDVSREHLQAYRHEYVFRHNGRRTPIAAFQTPLGRGTPHPTTHQQITTRTRSPFEANRIGRTSFIPQPRERQRGRAARRRRGICQQPEGTAAAAERSKVIPGARGGRDNRHGLVCVEEVGNDGAKDRHGC